MINVTKTFLPDFYQYVQTIKRAWDKAHLTNNGDLVQELEFELKKYLGVKHLWFTGNGTIVLQMALKALGHTTGEVITTPFSYVATTNAIIWEGFTPVFVDINERDFCIDANKIEAAITDKTIAILATHVYGNPCDIENIDAIAKRHNIKVIYDAAHAFGATYKGKQILSYGDISTCSFHATKVFHTVEGGCIITHDDALSRKLELYRQFGHIGDDYYSVGINGKNSEFHAAMGICNFPYLDTIIEARKTASFIYNKELAGCAIYRPLALPETDYNYAYYPVLFKDEDILINVRKLLAHNDIFTRRYFYPSLNKLPFLNDTNQCPISENISKRVLSLPLSAEIKTEEITTICALIKSIV
jgi:dTDP-4-amino-4,6-dideoxygalactose transaminase